MNPPLFHNRIRKVCALGAATLILPALAYAQNNQGDNQLAALQAQITALQNQVNTLQSQLNAVLSSQVYQLNHYVTVDTQNTEIGVKPPNIIFHGANIHIVSGFSGATNDNSGLGNLIIGYDEDPASAFPGSPGLKPAERYGSHNLVIGRYHRFTQNAFGGLVAGEGNTTSAGIESVMGGIKTVSGLGASVTGGFLNNASGFCAVVIGGSGVTASSQFSIGPQPLSNFPFP
jgi:hypothetical protein